MKTTTKGKKERKMPTTEGIIPGDKASKGRGVDIGTAFVKCAKKQADKIVFKTERNAFFEIEQTDFTKNMLESSKVKYIVKEDKLYIVGDESLEFANMFSRETRRPLSRGVISSTEKEALPMVELLIKSVVGHRAYEGEMVYFSVPGEPLDADFNIIYHIKMIEGFLKTLGYTPKTINEGHAIILSELAEKDFTGIGISFGGGMVNVCFSFMSVPIFKFSVTKAGDWIDRQVAMAVDEPDSRVSVIKESSLDLNKAVNLSKIESALSIYYNHLIEYVLGNIKQQFTTAQRLPVIKKPINIVLSGGTSLAKGFADRFREMLERIKLPIPVGEVIMAKQPLRTVAEGALVAAMADESGK